MSTIATPSPVDDGLDPSSGGVVAQDQTAALWQTAILAIGRRVATAVGNTDQLTSDAALALAEALDFDFCGVAQPPANGGLSIALNAAKFSVSLPTEPLILPDRPDDSLVAFAMASGRLIATPDIAAETRYRDLILRRCQAHSALACPLRANGVNYGSILLANLAPRVVSAHEFACIENICHLVAGAAARCRLEQLLSVSQFNGQVLEAVDTSLVLLDADLRIEQINQRCEDLTGFLLSEVQHRPYCSAFVATGEEDDIKQIFAQILSDGEPRQFKAKLLRKHGDERRVEWRFRRIAGSLPGVLVGTGVDITEKCDLEEQVAKLRQALSAPRESREFDEQRRLPRRPYPYRQRLAPMHDGQAPGLDEFEEVECRDISAGGFSFYADQEPSATQVVIAFGVEGLETFMVARIVHVRTTKHNSKPVFVVGCQYTGRHQYTA